MSSAWDMVSLDPETQVVLRMPLYWLTVSNYRCWSKPDDGVVILLNKENGKLRIGERILCLDDRARNTETS